MRAAAVRLGAPEEQELWGLAGLLHDADYQRWPEEHPQRIVAWLREQEQPALAHAISAHYTKWEVPYVSLMDKALVACDELTGFLGACAMIRPEGIATMKAKSVMKKLKDKKFAAGVEREEVQAGCAMIGMEVREWVEFLIPELQPFAAELGWEGRGG